MRIDHEYLEAQVMTAPPPRLHLMVVDAAIRFARRAEQALRDRDAEAAHAALNRSRALVSELIAGLDAQQAPELVERLKGLFLFVYRSLAEADAQRDANAVHCALRVLDMHRATWVQLLERMPAAGAPAVPASLETPQAARSWST